MLDCQDARVTNLCELNHAPLQRFEDGVAVFFRVLQLRLVEHEHGHVLLSRPLRPSVDLPAQT